MKAPEGATFTREDSGEVLMHLPNSKGEVCVSVPLTDWLGQNCAPGSSAQLIQTAAGEIVGVAIEGPSDFAVPSFGPVTGRRFRLVRHEDMSGVSGTGVVAHGIEFPDGVVALRWSIPGLPPSTAVWESIEAVERVHGHQGKTEIEWVD